jgi:hypothetical protein
MNSRQDAEYLDYNAVSRSHPLTAKEVSVAVCLATKELLN